VSEQDWIPVSEKMPDVGRLVLACEPTENMPGYCDAVIAFCSPNADGSGLHLVGTTRNGHVFFRIKATHWMELPLAPKSQKVRNADPR